MNMYNMEKQHKLGKLHALEPVSYTHLFQPSSTKRRRIVRG